jgi:hypothetical protein
MKKSLLLALLCISLLVKASNEKGGQISAKDLGGSQYQVSIKLWVDSIGLIPSTLFYQVQSGGTTMNDTADLTSNVSIGNSIQEVVYLDTISLNALATYKIMYSQCCRNAAITNVNNPSMQLFCISTTVNNNPAITNSTPEFVNSPDFFASPNDTLIHNPLAVDPDGDSLVFYWMNPLGNNYVSIPLTVMPYPAGAMSFSVDSITGQISWIPSMTGKYIYAVKVEEYRNGVLLSTAMRDAQIDICVGCKTAMSSEFQFYNMNAWPMVGNYYQFQAYANTAFNFTFDGGVSSINSNALNMNLLGDVTYMANPATFTATQTMSSIAGTWNWTPNATQVRNRPYLNVLVGKETNNLNQNRKKEKTILVKVNAIPTTTDNVLNEQKLVTYPNPTNHEMMIELNNTQAEYVSLDIYSSMGQRMYHQVLNQKAIEAALINTSAWSAGNYIIRVNGQQSMSRQFTVIH